MIFKKLVLSLADWILNTWGQSNQNYKELMVKLALWILNTWNPSNPHYKVTLKPSEANQMQYNLTPISNNRYLLLYLKPRYGERRAAAPPYQWYINLDLCIEFFEGVNRFQSFFNESNQLLQEKREHKDTITAISKLKF